MAQRGTSGDKMFDRSKGHDNWVSKLNTEAEGLKLKLVQVEESKSALTNNRSLRETQDKYEQQIQMLESDKVSLMKRLNMVLSELEKATHEKAEINSKLIDQERMADDLKRKLDEVSSLKNVVNRNLQEDLRYERDLNEKLREELSKFEREKESLISKLKEQEGLSTDIQRETQAINTNLQRKIEELKKLEREHEFNLNKLRDLNNMLDSLRGQEIHSTTEKRRMEDELEDLTRERNELIRRMNELSDKYEDYVSTMNRERIEIMKANKNHVKLLTSKLLFQILQETIHWRRKHALCQIKMASASTENAKNKMKALYKVLNKFQLDQKQRYLRLWYRNSMNFIHEHYKKLNLVEYNVDKKRKIQFFYKWRQAFLSNKQAYDSKIDSLKLFRSLLSQKQSQKLRRYICKWRDFVQLRQFQQNILTSIMERKRKRNLSQGFVMWVGHVKKLGLNDRYDKMSDLVTNLWFKQRVFLGLRQAVLESKSEGAMLKFKTWKSNCHKEKEKKYFQKKKLLILRLQGTRTERLLKQCFDAIKFFNIQLKYEETQARLDIEIPAREELERQRDILIKTSKGKDKFNLFRQMFSRYADLQHRAIVIWKENVDYYNRTMQRAKLRLIELHKKNISKSFFYWKEQIDKKHMVELVAFTEDLVNENQELTNTMQQCQREKEKLQDCTTRQQGLKLERIRNMLNRNLLRHRFAQWAHSATFIVSVESAVEKGTKIIQRRRVRNAFNKYKKIVSEMKRLQYIKNKVNWFGSVRDQKVYENCFEAWRQYVKRYKLAKVFLMRSIKGVDKLIQNESFGKWKKYVYSERKQVYYNNIEELGKRQIDHETSIKEMDLQIQVNESSQKHLESKLKTQSHRIMANFINRFVYSSQAKGFFTWLDVLKEHKSKRRFLRSTMNFWIKNAQAKAFRCWAVFSLNSKEAELHEKLKNRESERRALQQLKEDEDAQQTKEVEKMSHELKEATQLKDQIKGNYEKAMEIYVSRLKNNTYIDKKRNIFLVWKDFIKLEKNAINVIGAIARRNLRMEVFSRIRLAAREKWLDNKANKTLSNFMRLFKQALIRKAFSKWRLNNYNETVFEMEVKKDLLATTLIKNENELQCMQVQKHAKAEKILKQKRQREIANAWITMTKLLRQLRIKNETMVQNLRYMQLRCAMKKWNQRAKVTSYLRRKDLLVIKKYQSKSLKACFQGWANNTRISKALCKRVTKFMKRLQTLDLAHGFQQIVHYSKSFQERIKERKDQGNKTIFKSLCRLYKHKLTDTFLSLKTRVHKRDFKMDFLTKTIKHTLLHRLRHFFGKWKHNVERTVLAEQINSEGDVVLERNDMRRNVKALKDFLNQQGYSEEDINNYLIEKEGQQKTNMHKAVVGLFFKNSDFKIMPAAFNQWKRWIQQRKLCRQWAKYVNGAMNHPLFWAFRKWKYDEVLAKDKLKTVTKKDLIEKIISDEMAIGSAQSRVVRMDEAIENLNIQRDSLLQHFISGQKLALVLGKNNHQRSMFRAFLRWKKFTKDEEQRALAEQLQRTDQMINDLMGHVHKLEGINKNLSGENEELRQAALDGIEIAKAVQELTREREQLSVDLQDRASTIKKLIEDNNNLSQRLNIAQKEAEQLEQLNQQSFMAPPERDRYY